MALQIRDRFHSRQCKETQAAIDAGNLTKIDELGLFDDQQMRPMAVLSLQLLGLGALFFAVLNLVVYTAYTHQFFPQFSFSSFLLWLFLNIVGYCIILPLHEIIHGIAFAFWGGRPHFGAKLPFALYCGAKEQLFRRDQYVVVGLAPFIVITLAGILFIAFSPSLASYSLLALIGNVSGAAGDLWVAERIRRLPKNVLIEDTETGYRAWEVKNSVQG